MSEDKMIWSVEPPFTVQVANNEGREELCLNKLYTVVGVKPDLINSDNYGFKLLEQQPEEPYDSYLSTRFIVKVGILPN